MSAVSSATLVSPPPSVHHQPPPAAGPSARQRMHPHASAHHPHGAHHPRRKASGHGGPIRRGSEGEGGRRAMTSALMMQGLESALQPPRRKSGDRPTTKSSRSDTHLPRLSRNTSAVSLASNSERPKAGRKKSGDTVTVVSEDGVEKEQNASEGEDWESGEDESVIMTKTRDKGKGRASGASTPMRRSTSAPLAKEVATAMEKGDSMGAALATGARPATPHMHRQKTTGFAGLTITPDPSANSELVHGEVNHNYNDNMHVMPAHQIKHQKSARSLHTLAMEAGPAAPAEDGRPRVDSPHRLSSGASAVASQGSSGSVPDVMHRNPVRTGSTSGSGMPKALNEAGRQTSFPFPKTGSPSPIASMRRDSKPIKETITDPAPSPAPPAEPVASSPRERKASGRSIKQRTSNSSLRSTQSTRMPPHPLNAPRPPSLYTASPTKGRRAPTLLQPPLAPPVVYRETASGAGYDIPEDEAVGPMEASTSSHQTDARTRIDTSSTEGSGVLPKSTMGGRKGSFSSITSLRGNLSSMLGGNKVMPPSPAPSEASRTGGRQLVRRRTAQEAAEAASRMNTTSDSSLYHHSLGHSPAAAEIAHLISRFLPPKRGKRPVWEVTGTERAAGTAPPGLVQSEYRDAHESLIRMMKEMGHQTSTPANKRALSRSQSGYNIIPTVGSSSSLVNMARSADGEPGVGVGVVKGKHGVLVVARGGWRGRTPMELSIERCLAQRPQRTLSQLS